MAKAPMAFTRSEFGTDVEILFNSEYVGRAITLDTTAFEEGICKAGTPIDKDGKKLDGETADNIIGILLLDVYEERPQGTVVMGGYINQKVAQEHSGVTIGADQKTALNNIVFVDTSAGE